jgi:hypothetical protein
MNTLSPFAARAPACAADDELEIRTLVSFHGKASVQYILDITPLNEVRFVKVTDTLHNGAP